MKYLSNHIYNVQENMENIGSGMGSCLEFRGSCPTLAGGRGVTAPKLGCIPSLPLWEVFTTNRNYNSFLKQKPALLRMHHIFKEMYSAVAKTICTSTHTHQLFCSDFKSNMLFTESLKNRRIKKITGHF